LRGRLRNEPNFGGCSFGAFQFGFLCFPLGFAAFSSCLARCHGDEIFNTGNTAAKAVGSETRLETA
jgi:hypothetical protein